MLLDYATQEQKPKYPEEGVRVAGLLDFAKLLKYLGNSVDAGTVSSIRSGVKAAPEQFYGEQKLFIDPRNRLMRDTGSTYEGRPLPEYGSLRALVEEGPTLRDYLQGTEIGDVFAKDLSRVKVGVTELPAGYGAGYTAPQGFKMRDTGDYRHLQDGFLVVNKNVNPDDIGGMFEHEMQHAYQNILDMPRGTNTDEMSGPVVDYLTDVGQISPNRLARIDNSARYQGVSEPYLRYAATTGEAEARAAEVRHNAARYGVNVGVPKTGEYTWTHEGPRITREMLFDIPQNTQEGFNAWLGSRGRR